MKLNTREFISHNSKAFKLSLFAILLFQISQCSTTFGTEEINNNKEDINDNDMQEPQKVKIIDIKQEYKEFFENHIKSYNKKLQCVLDIKLQQWMNKIPNKKGMYQPYKFKYLDALLDTDIEGHTDRFTCYYNKLFSQYDGEDSNYKNKKCNRFLKYYDKIQEFVQKYNKYVSEINNLEKFKQQCLDILKKIVEEEKEDYKTCQDEITSFINEYKNKYENEYKKNISDMKQLVNNNIDKFKEKIEILDKHIQKHSKTSKNNDNSIMVTYNIKKSYLRNIRRRANYIEQCYNLYCENIMKLDNYINEIKLITEGLEQDKKDLRNKLELLNAVQDDKISINDSSFMTYVDNKNNNNLNESNTESDILSSIDKSISLYEQDENRNIVFNSFDGNDDIENDIYNGMGNSIDNNNNINSIVSNENNSKFNNSTNINMNNKSIDKINEGKKNNSFNYD